MQINGQSISWRTVVGLYEKHRLGGCGLSILPKLTAEHIRLNSYSKMKVKLAVQVLHSDAYTYSHADQDKHSYNTGA